MIYRCGHAYHLHCAVAWLQRRDACPVCGTSLMDDEPVPVYDESIANWIASAAAVQSQPFEARAPAMDGPRLLQGGGEDSNPDSAAAATPDRGNQQSFDFKSVLNELRHSGARVPSARQLTARRHTASKKSSPAASRLDFSQTDSDGESEHRSLLSSRSALGSGERPPREVASSGDATVSPRPVQLRGSRRQHHEREGTGSSSSAASSRTTPVDPRAGAFPSKRLQTARGGAPSVASRVAVDAAAAAAEPNHQTAGTAAQRHAPVSPPAASPAIPVAPSSAHDDVNRNTATSAPRLHGFISSMLRSCCCWTTRGIPSGQEPPTRTVTASPSAEI